MAKQRRTEQSRAVDTHIASLPLSSSLGQRTSLSRAGNEGRPVKATSRSAFSKGGRRSKAGSQPCLGDWRAFSWVARDGFLGSPAPRLAPCSPAINGGGGMDTLQCGVTRSVALSASYSVLCVRACVPGTVLDWAIRTRTIHPSNPVISTASASCTRSEQEWLQCADWG